jgi:hypothetical protein
VLLAPAVVILAFVGSQTGFSEHMRYVLPIFPFVYIRIGVRLAFVFERAWWGAQSSHLAPRDEIRAEAAKDLFCAPDNALELPVPAQSERNACASSRPDFILRSKMTTFGRRAVTGQCNTH